MMVGMTPEDKAMTEKSMQMQNSEGSAGKIPLRSDTFTAAENTELDADGNRVEKEQGQNSEKESSVTKKDGDLPPTNTADEKTRVNDGEKKENETSERKRLFGLFQKKKRLEPDTHENSPSIDATTKQLTTEALASMVDDKLRKMNGDDFLIIKINKTAFFVLGGILVLSLWLQPLIQHSSSVFEQVKMKVTTLFTKPVVETDEKQPEEIVSPDVNSGKKLVRVRLWSDDEEEGLFVESLFREMDGLSYSIVIDPEVEGEDVTIAVRDEDVDLEAQLKEVLDPYYEIASTAAVLSADSDFNASVLIGKDARNQ